MTEEQLIELLLKEIEKVLYLDETKGDKAIAEMIIEILEDEYDI